jgi:hypothetical protein
MIAARRSIPRPQRMVVPNWGYVLRRHTSQSLQVARVMHDALGAYRFVGLQFLLSYTGLINTRKVVRSRGDWRDEARMMAGNEARIIAGIMHDALGVLL